jgi:hypothetical protein
LQITAGPEPGFGGIALGVGLLFLAAWRRTRGGRQASLG